MVLWFMMMVVVMMVMVVVVVVMVLIVPCCQVTMENAVDNQIHLSQSVPMSSPLTWKLTGDIGEELSSCL